MRFLTLAACLLIAASTVAYAADNDRGAVKKKTPDYQRFDDWATKKMIPEDTVVDDWVRRWMERDRTLSFDSQIERTFRQLDGPDFSETFPPGQPFPPSYGISVDGVRIGGFPPREQ